MRSTLKPTPHTGRPGEFTIEVWYDGKLIATVVAADGPGVKLVSKHPKRYAEMPMILAAELHVDTTRLMPGVPGEAV